MSALEPQEYVTETADGRGRVNLGTDYGGDKLTYLVLDPDSFERLEGPTTSTVATDGRLSLGSEFANQEVTVGIVRVDAN